MQKRQTAIQFEVNRMKEKYIKPEMEIIEFECEDIITTSDLDPDEGENELPIV